MVLTLNSSLRIVFMLYAVFWIFVLIALFLGVGALLKRRERILEQQRRRELHRSH
jgi:hypothetical protein